MKLLTGLFRACRRKLMTRDNDMGMFRDKLTELVDNKDSLSDEDITSKVEELKQITDDLPDSEDKTKLVRFLEDFKAVKEQDTATAKEAVGPVADLFEKLDTEAMKDVPQTTEAQDEEKPEDTEESDEIVEKTEAPEGKTVKDNDPNAQYSLEEIYQFIKKRMAEDADADGTEPEETTEDACEEKQEEVTADHAPRIPVTVNDNAISGSLSALYELAKKGGR